MILLIDNYDSFTYNLFQLLSVLHAEVEVRRNDAISLDDIEHLEPEGIVISPGPGEPSDAGVSCSTLERFAHTIPLLGVCLGHQCLGAAYGAKIVRTAKVVHGKTSEVFHNGQGVFAGVPNPFRAVRYHSLAVDRSSLPQDLEITAWTDDGLIMGLRHRKTGAEGVQFHPESVLTLVGPQIMRNFLDRCVSRNAATDTRTTDCQDGANSNVVMRMGVPTGLPRNSV